MTWPEEATKDIWLYWVCQRNFSDNEGVSLNDTGPEDVCREYWDTIDPQWRIIVCAILRRIDQGGLGITELMVDAMRSYPFGGPRTDGRNGV